MTPRPPPRPRRTRCRGVYASRPPPWSPRPQDGAAKPPSSWAAGRGRESSRLTGCGRDSGHLGWMEETCQVSSGPPTTPAGWGSSRGALQAVLCLRVHLSVRLSVCSLSAGRRGWPWSRLLGRARLAGLRGTPPFSRLGFRPRPPRFPTVECSAGSRAFPAMAGAPGRWPRAARLPV